MNANNLIEARHSAQFTVSDLQGALKNANGIEALVLLPMIKSAVELVQRIDELINAYSEATMTLVRDDAQQFWAEDLGVIEKRFLGARSVTDLPAMKEEWRVPNQGSVLAFSTVNTHEVIGKPSLRVWARALEE